MESTRDSIMAIALLLAVLVAIVGSLLANPAITVYLVVLATFLNGVILVKLTLMPKK